VNELLKAVAATYSDIFGSRLLAVAAHGSAITGDAFPGFSDVDFVVVLDSPLILPDAEAVGARLDAIDITPFAYVQAAYCEVNRPTPSVVPGGFALFLGDIGVGFMHTNESLRSAGDMWLRDLPQLVDTDMRDWSVAVNRRARQLRLLITRLKPTVRAYLVISGDSPIPTYRSPWPSLVDRLRVHEPQLATDLSSLVAALRTRTPDIFDAGGKALRLLIHFTRITR
jgi:hypothetical protein